MVVGILAGLSLFVTVAVEPFPATREPGTMMSAQQKSAAMRPLVRSATECVARTVVADPRYRELKQATEVNDLIVDSMARCAEPVRAMIEGYDRVYGEGRGEEFFMGPYLDFLPTAVSNLIKEKTD